MESSDRFFTRPFLVLAILASGVVSGLLGIGGGVMLVPSLVYLGGLNQKIAHATSLCGIVIIATSAMFGYLADGSVNFWAALCIAPGAWIGVRLGTLLLKKISTDVLKLIFGLLAIIVAARLIIGISEGTDNFNINFLAVLGLLSVGLIAGFISGLFGVGGGIIMVPSLIIFFEFMGGDARGTSLLVILTTATIGTYSNYRLKNVDLKIGLKLGIVGASTSIVGSIISRYISDSVTAWILAGVLVAVALRMFYESWKIKSK